MLKKVLFLYNAKSMCPIISAFIQHESILIFRLCYCVFNASKNNHGYHLKAFYLCTDSAHYLLNIINIDKENSFGEIPGNSMFI